MARLQFSAACNSSVSQDCGARFGTERCMSWLNTIIAHHDYVRNRYEAFPVCDDAARDGVMQVLEEVRRKELKRVHGSTSTSMKAADSTALTSSAPAQGQGRPAEPGGVPA